MSGDVHVRFCERLGVRLPRATRLNVYVKSERAAHRVMASVSRFIETRLRLKVNRDKSTVSGSAQVHFVGFTLHPRTDSGVAVHLSKRTKDRLNRRIRELTPRNWGQSVERCIEELNRYLKGWHSYFALCTPEEAWRFKRFDAHIRRRLRAIIVKQKKRPRFLYRHLLSRGISTDAASRAAWHSGRTWKQSASAGLHRAYPNRWFAQRLFSLRDAQQERFARVLVASTQLALPGV